MIDWATDVIDEIGLAGVALLIALESILPPIPSELVLLLTGFNVEQGRFELAGAVVAATVGSVLGAVALYALGAWISEDRLERFLARAGRFLGFTRADIDRGFRWFERHGAAVVFFGRLIPFVRSVVSIPAGAERMPMRRFLPLTAAGSLVWNAAWIAVGDRLGASWRKAEKWGEAIELAAVAATLVLGIALVVRARRRRRALEET